MANNSDNRSRKARIRSGSKSLKSATSPTKRSGALTQRNSKGKSAVQDVATLKFVAAKTGRIVKSSPAKPNLSMESIQAAVRAYLNRDVGTGRF